MGKLRRPPVTCPGWRGQEAERWDLNLSSRIFNHWTVLPPRTHANVVQSSWGQVVENGSNFKDSAWLHCQVCAFLLSQSWNSTAHPQSIFDRGIKWLDMRVKKKKITTVIERFTECRMENDIYRNRPSKVITVFAVVLPDDKPEAQWGKATCLRLHSHRTLQVLKSDTFQWVPFFFFSGTYLWIRAESLYGFQPRQWKLYPGLVSLLADHVICELVSDKLLEQGVPLNTCPPCGIKKDCGVGGAHI